MGLRATGRTARDDRVRPGAREGARGERQARRPLRHRAGGERRRLQQIPKTPGTFDFVFLDAWKKDYKRFFDMVYPRLDKRGLFLAHNVVNKRNEMGDFLDAVQKHPSLWTTIVSPSGEGMSVSMRVKCGFILSSAAAPRGPRRRPSWSRASCGSWRRERRRGAGSSLGSSFDMLVRNFFMPCSSNWTRVYASSTAITEPSP